MATHITECSSPELLPFARARIKALRATGRKYASQKFDISGARVDVRVVGEHDYINISGSGRIWVLLTLIELPRIRNFVPLPGDPTVAQSADIHKRVISKLYQLPGNFDASAAKLRYEGSTTRLIHQSWDSWADPGDPDLTYTSTERTHTYEVTGAIGHLRGCAPYDSLPVLWTSTEDYDLTHYQLLGGSFEQETRYTTPRSVTFAIGNTTKTYEANHAYHVVVAGGIGTVTDVWSGLNVGGIFGFLEVKEFGYRLLDMSVNGSFDPAPPTAGSYLFYKWTKADGFVLDENGIARIATPPRAPEAAEYTRREFGYNAQTVNTMFQSNSWYDRRAHLLTAGAASTTFASATRAIRSLTTAAPNASFSIDKYSSDGAAPVAVIKIANLPGLMDDPDFAEFFGDHSNWVFAVTNIYTWFPFTTFDDPALLNISEDFSPMEVSDVGGFAANSPATGVGRLSMYVQFIPDQADYDKLS